MSKPMSRLTEREAQAKAVIEGERESLDDDNPIIYAESAPCRYQSITYWFPDDDGVVIEENLDREGEITVKYMDGDETIELTEGALYDWAMERWEED